MGEPAAVDVECFEDVADGCEGNAPVEAPENDIEVFLAGFETIENAIEKKCLIREATLQEAEVAAVELDPELLALQMFQPARPQIAPPMILDPLADGFLAQIVADFLA